MHILLPYGKTEIGYDFPENTEVITSNIGALAGKKQGSELVKEAMETPIDSPRLYELAQGKKTAVIIISDHTRPVPSRDILPHMLYELRKGNSNIDVTLLVATGCHRETTKDELKNKLGSEVFNNEKIIIHDCNNKTGNIQVGVLPSGAPLVIDKLAMEAELVVAEGFIEPHFFAGFSGGRKSILPGICDCVTVLGNHCSKFIDNEYSRTGILDNNPIHADMIEASRLAKLQFIVNVIVDESHKTVAAFAGDVAKAHRAGCDFLDRYCKVAPKPADIVVTTNGGAPLDQNIYQCVKGMTAAEASANKGAVIIVCAECADGVGGDFFYRQLAECKDAQSLYDEFMATRMDKTRPDQWQSQVLARILINHEVIFVSREALRKELTDMKMSFAPSIDKAMKMAYANKGRNASVTVIPNGISVIVSSRP